MRQADSLADRRVFVVEDEALVLMDLEDMLAELGCEIAGSAMQLPKARALAETVAADAAVLDVNVAGQLIFPVAQILHDRGIPIAFASGYGQSSLLAGWEDHPMIRKPYTAGEVAERLREALTGVPPD